MNTHTSTSLSAAELAARPKVAEKKDVTERMAVAFGLSAAVTVVFNTLLAWVKDAYDPLNELMKAATGHHWRTHGIVDVILFFVLGYIFMSRGTAAQLTDRLVVTVAAAAVVAGAGLAAWFFFV